MNFCCRTCGLTHTPIVVARAQSIHGVPGRVCVCCGGETFAPVDDTNPTKGERVFWPYPAQLLVGSGNPPGEPGLTFFAACRDGKAAGIDGVFTWDWQGEDSESDPALESLDCVLACKSRCETIIGDQASVDAMVDTILAPQPSAEAEAEAERLGLGTEDPLHLAARMAVAWLWGGQS